MMLRWRQISPAKKSVVYMSCASMGLRLSSHLIILCCGSPSRRNATRRGVAPKWSLACTFDASCITTFFRDKKSPVTMACKEEGA